MLNRTLIRLVILGAAVGVSACAPDAASNTLEPSGAASIVRATGTRIGTGVNQGGYWGGTTKESCTPLPPITTRAAIGASGGTLRIGPHTLTVPAGALAGTVTISGSTSGDSVNSVQFLPQGLQFSVPAMLTLSYRNCRDQNDPTKTMKIVYTSDDLTLLLALLPSKDDRIAKSVSSTVSHFSRYAVAY